MDECPYCHKGIDCPLHRKENRMQKIVFTFEVMYKDGTIKRDADAVAMLREYVTQMSQHPAAKEVYGKVAEHARQGVGKIAKELLGRVQYVDGRVTGGTNMENWRAKHKAEQEEKERKKQIIAKFLIDNQEYDDVTVDEFGQVTVYFKERRNGVPTREPWGSREFVRDSPTRLLLDKLEEDLRGE